MATQGLSHEMVNTLKAQSTVTQYVNHIKSDNQEHGNY